MKSSKTLQQYLDVLGEPTTNNTSTGFVWWDLFKVSGQEHLYNIYIQGRKISVGFYLIRVMSGNFSLQDSIAYSHFQTSEATPLSLEEVLNLNPPEDVKNKLLFNLDLFV